MTLRTPFFLKLGQSEIRFILSYLNYTFIPKNDNDPIFGSDAYFFGVNFYDQEDELYVLCNDFQNLYGLYADTWSFPKAIRCK